MLFCGGNNLEAGFGFGCGCYWILRIADDLWLASFVAATSKLDLALDAAMIGFYVSQVTCAA